MLRPLDDGLSTIPQSESEDWSDRLPVDGYGRATDDLTEQLLRTFFSEPTRCFTLAELVEQLFSESNLLLIRLRWLTAVNVIEEHPVNSLQFRVTEAPWNRQFFQRIQEQFAPKRLRQAA